MDMYCKNKRCPICDSELFEEESVMDLKITKCINDCYSIHIHPNGMSFYSFRSFIITHNKKYYHNKYHCSMIKTRIEEKINYWKENDRYLIKIIEGHNNV